MEINRDAPAVASSEIEVAAPREVVWDVLADFERWPDWNPDVKSVSMDGPVTPGTEFRWKAGPGTITSTLRSVERPSELAWTGKTMGISAIHVWRFDSRNGKTVVRTEESWEGLLVRVLRGRMGRMLQEDVDASMPLLRAAAERRASGPSDPAS